VSTGSLNAEFNTLQLAAPKGHVPYSIVWNLHHAALRLSLMMLLVLVLLKMLTALARAASYGARQPREYDETEMTRKVLLTWLMESHKRQINFIRCC
jgi:hypothetical protein